MKLLWLTDIHLNFLTSNDRENFYQSLNQKKANAILITGDIADAPLIEKVLKEMANIVQRPIYFVMGNHDYYHGSVNEVRGKVAQLSQNSKFLNWLGEAGIITLNANTVLIGQDCWADGRLGDYANSPVVLNDSVMIEELFEASILGKGHLLKAMQKLADKDAHNLKNNLTAAIKENKPQKIIILIHTPPFRESCMHEGKISNDDFLPFFSSKITGDALLEIAEKYPEIEFLVLCGHTHSESYFKPCNNLTVKAGPSEYRYPEIQEIIEIE